METKIKSAVKQPKFKVGDTVNCSRTLYDETEGVVTEVERVFQDINPDGSFDMDGLATLEHTISSIQIPYEFDGETLKVHYPASVIKLTDGELRQNAKTRTAKFKSYAYTVRTPKMNTIFSERSLKLKK